MTAAQKMFERFNAKVSPVENVLKKDTVGITNRPKITIA